MTFPDDPAAPAPPDAISTTERGDSEAAQDSKQAPPQPAGWYADPYGRLRYRYWDGTQWTAYAANTEVQWDAAAVETPVPREPGMRGLVAATIGFAVSLGLSLAISAALIAAHRPGGRAVTLLIAELGLWAGLVGACVYVSRRRGTGSLIRDYAWRFKWSDIGIGFAGAFVARFVTAFMVAPIPMPFRRVRAPDKSIFTRVAHGPGAWTIIVVVTCVGAPLVEELFFRGLLQTRLVGLWGPAVGIPVSSVLFGSAHLVAWQGPITLAYGWGIAGGGLVLGIIRHYTGRLGPSTMAHMFFNLQVVILVALLQ